MSGHGFAYFRMLCLYEASDCEAIRRLWARMNAEGDVRMALSRWQKYYRLHAERLRAAARKRYRENHTKALAIARKHYRKNREVIIEKWRIYRTLNAEKLKSRRLESYSPLKRHLKYMARRDRELQENAAWRKANPERHRMYAKKAIDGAASHYVRGMWKLPKDVPNTFIAAARSLLLVKRKLKEVTSCNRK